MTAEIGSFTPVYLERITQLVNKTNQFNLTTRRFTSAEIDAIGQDRAFITLYARLADKFGDNGLVSVLIGQVVDETVEINVWLMSCRVLNRELEFAMFDALVEQCQVRGIRRIAGIQEEQYGCWALPQPGFQFDGRGHGRPRVVVL